jgi:radical SAM superfamily enzyme YgiQ (UPF0313 family)
VYNVKILLVYPSAPTTFWSLENALKFISKKSVQPPLGLLTVASLLPVAWEKRLIDMNVSPLKDEQILWADYVFLSGMSIHKKEFENIVTRCNRLGVKVVAGGPLATVRYKELEGVDHFVLNEAEITLPLFLEDLKNGHPKKIYATGEFADIEETPIPQWNILDMKKYATMDLQYSRGCPYNCEFCSITTLYGRRPRTKGTEQFLRELESLYQVGWRGNVFIVDDNFIGAKKKLKENFLPALIEWSETRNYPFSYSTEVSIELADDVELMQLMVQAGFKMVFVGIETPVEESLAECGKIQNRKRNMLESVKKMQRHGLDVTGGFIVGFDNDRLDVFDRQIGFIQSSGIVTAMVGLLNAPLGTRLFKRLLSENRILECSQGDNVNAHINFIPKMNRSVLIKGYKRILKTIYSQKEYFERIKTFLAEYQLPAVPSPKAVKRSVLIFLKVLWKLGIVEKGKRFFWKLLFHVLHDCPQKFSQAMQLAIYGFHFRRVVAEI